MRSVGRTSRWAGTLATLCGIHCLAMPVVVLVLPAVWAVEAFEMWAIAGVSVMAVPLGVWSARLHRNPGPPLLTALGLVVWWSTAEVHLVQGEHRLLPVFGSVLVAVALFWNSRLVHAHDCAVSHTGLGPAHVHPDGTTHGA